MPRSIFRATFGLALVCGVACLAGCGPSYGSVSGTITLGGDPLPGGMVSFMSEDGSVVSAYVELDGTYRANNVPTGLARVTVYPTEHTDPASGEVLKNQGRDPRIKDAPRTGPPPVPVPIRYGAADTSGLSVNVSKGETRYDIPLDK
jgi:hypothetical protein